MRPTALLAAALLLAACSDPLQPRLDFSSSASDNTLETAVASSPLSGLLQIRGTAETINACQSASGTVTGGAAITLTVRLAGSTAPECGTEPGYVDYEAVVQGLNTGTIRVVVIHAPVGGEQRTVLDRDVFIE